MTTPTTDEELAALREHRCCLVPQGLPYSIVESLIVRLDQAEQRVRMLKERNDCLAEDFIELRKAIGTADNDDLSTIDWIHRLKREAAQAEEERDDWRDGARKVLAEKCPTDEKHCSCVPVLRKRVRELEQTNAMLREGHALKAEDAEHYQAEAVAQARRDALLEAADRETPLSWLPEMKAAFRGWLRDMADEEAE